MLWTARNLLEAGAASDSVRARFETGIRVGGLARSYFGEYAKVPYSNDKGAMIEATTRLIDTGAKVIAEVSFSYNGNFLAAFCRSQVILK
jgi:hypothetical protein